jgi:hypothetical protein
VIAVGVVGVPFSATREADTQFHSSDCPSSQYFCRVTIYMTVSLLRSFIDFWYR